MKISLLILVILSSASIYFFNKDSHPQILLNKKTIFSKAGSIDFKTQVQPILQKNCSPCHFPGGKLYEKLPFDNGQTIIGREAGVIKRLKDEKEKELVSSYIQQNTSPKK